MRTAKTRRLWGDQYGNMIWATTVKELKQKAGPGRVFKIYRDKKDGTSVHCGYGVGKRWFDAYVPCEVEA